MRYALLGSVMALALIGTAHASVTLSSTPYEQAPPSGQTLIDTFDSPIAAGYTFTGGEVETGSLSGVYAAPAGDATSYVAVQQELSALLTSSKALSALSLYVGSLDAYNTISFLRDGLLVESFSGSSIVPNADGDQNGGATNRLLDFDLNGSGVNQVQFTSSQPALEFDNIAASAVPEPSVWTLMIAGIGGIGLMLRGTRRAMGRGTQDAFGT